MPVDHPKLKSNAQVKPPRERGADTLTVTTRLLLELEVSLILVSLGFCSNPLLMDSPFVLQPPRAPIPIVTPTTRFVAFTLADMESRKLFLRVRALFFVQLVSLEISILEE